MTRGYQGDPPLAPRGGFLAFSTCGGLLRCGLDVGVLLVQPREAQPPQGGEGAVAHREEEARQPEHARASLRPRAVGFHDRRILRRPAQRVCLVEDEERGFRLTPEAESTMPLPSLDALPPGVPIVYAGIFVDKVYELSLVSRTFSADGYVWLEWPAAVQDQMEAEGISPIELIRISNRIEIWDSTFEPVTAEAAAVVSRIENSTPAGPRQVRPSAAAGSSAAVSDDSNRVLWRI